MTTPRCTDVNATHAGSVGQPLLMRTLCCLVRSWSRRGGVGSLAYVLICHDESAPPGKTATAQGFTGTSCCGYGTNGMNTNGYDCLIIPSATQQAMAGMVIAANAFCGRSVGIVSIAGTTATTVCCKELDPSGSCHPDHPEQSLVFLLQQEEPRSRSDSSPTSLSFKMRPARPIVASNWATLCLAVVAKQG